MVVIVSMALLVLFRFEKVDYLRANHDVPVRVKCMSENVTYSRYKDDS